MRGRLGAMGGTVTSVAGNRQAGFRATSTMDARAIVPTAGISKGKRLCPHVQAAGQHEKERCMERNEEALSPLDGISVNINKRHAFVHERVLEYIVRETNQAGGVIFNKKEMASWLGCCPRSLDRAVHRLREQGLVESQPQFMPNGAQGGNRYCATEVGKKHAETWRRRAGTV